MANATELFTLATIGFGVMLSIRFILNALKDGSDLWLGFYVLILIGCLTEILVRENVLVTTIIGSTYWLIGPVLYFFVRGKSLNQAFIMKHDYHHLLAFAIYVILLFASMIFTTMSNDLVDLIVYEAVFLHIFTYFYLCTRIVSKANTIAKTDPAIKMRRTFLVAIVILSFGIFASSWISTHVFALTGSEMTASFKMLVQALLAFLIFCISLLKPERPGYRLETRS